jgi:hypothetical protein
MVALGAMAFGDGRLVGDEQNLGNSFLALQHCSQKQIEISFIIGDPSSPPRSLQGDREVFPRRPEIV